MQSGTECKALGRQADKTQSGFVPFSVPNKKESIRRDWFLFIFVEWRKGLEVKLLIKKHSRVPLYSTESMNIVSRWTKTYNNDTI